MKRGLIICVVAALFFTSCTKSETSSQDFLQPAGSQSFEGKYVKKENTADTLVVSYANNQRTLFYNSETFRSNPAAYSHPELQTFQYEFRDGKIGVRNALLSSFVYYDFDWIEPGKIFKIQAMTLQPEISATTMYYTFVKIP